MLVEECSIEIQTPVNYLMNYFFENADVSKSKFVWVA